MGTSQSSNGPSSNVALIPSWIANPEQETTDGEILQPDATAGVELRPARAFAGVRRSLGSFARSGDREDMRRGLGHYIRTSYGGSSNATRRHTGTVRTAGALYNFLSDRQIQEERLDRSVLESRSATELMDAVVEAVRPVDGTQDAESSRHSIRNALADLLQQFPDANLLELSEEQRQFVVEGYISEDVFRRFELDVGTTIQDKAPDMRTALSRLKEIRDFVREKIRAAFREIRERGEAITIRTANRVFRDALAITFRVFDSYTQ